MFGDSEPVVDDRGDDLPLSSCSTTGTMLIQQLLRGIAMSHPVTFEIEVPDTLEGLRLPAGVDERLQSLLDRLDETGDLSAEEQREAEGLADLAELLSLLRLRARRLAG